MNKGVLVINGRGSIYVEKLMTPDEFASVYCPDESVPRDCSIELFDRIIADGYGLWNYSLDDISELADKKDLVLVDFGEEGYRVVETVNEGAA